MIDILFDQYDGYYPKEYIKERVDLLFPERNFIFFQWPRDCDSPEMRQFEFEQIENFVKDGSKLNMFYLEKGSFEPCHLT